MRISISFAQKGPVRELDFWNLLNKDLCGVRFMKIEASSKEM